MCEFYQIDLEMSFVEQEDVMKILQDFSLDVVKTLAPHKKLLFGDDFPRISYQEAMDSYGIDRPDLRFGMKIVDLTETLAQSEFKFFKETVADGGYVRAIKHNVAMSRKELDAMTEIAKRA